MLPSAASQTFATGSLAASSSLLAGKVQAKLGDDAREKDALSLSTKSLPASTSEEDSPPKLPTLNGISLDSSKLKVTPTTLPITNGNNSPVASNLSPKGQLVSGGPQASQGSRISHRLFEEKKVLAEAVYTQFDRDLCKAPPSSPMCHTPLEKESRRPSLQTMMSLPEERGAVNFDNCAPKYPSEGEVTALADPVRKRSLNSFSSSVGASSPRSSRVDEASSMVVSAPSGPSPGRPQRLSQDAKPRRSKKEDRASSGRIAEDRWIRLLNEVNMSGSSAVKASDEDVQRCAILAMQVEDALEEFFELAARANLDVAELGKLLTNSLVSRRASSHELRRSTGGTTTVTRGQTSYAYKHIQGSPSQLYDLMGEVGAGAFGSVRKATHLKTGEEHAVKCVPKAKIDSSCLWEEIEIMKLLDHPHIMRVYNTFEDDQYIYMCLELCAGGPFFDTLFRLGIIPESTSAMLFKQIMNVISYIHSRNICHRDIKPENFLVLKKGDIREAHLKLIDFGCSKRFDLTPMTTKICTPQYVAPEILLKGNISYTEKVDVWSCGVMLYLMLSGRLPFHRDNELEMLKLVKKGIWDFKPDNLWCIISDAAKELVRCCLCPVDKRFTAAQVLRSDWLQRDTTLGLRRLSVTTVNQVQKYLSESRLKRVSLRIIARQINDESISQLRNMFLELDDDCTGTLSAEEIQEAVGGMGVSEMKQRGMVELMCHLDPTGSGMIEYTEFLAATMTPEQYCQEDVCRAAFHRLDHDMDGVLSRKDLERLVSDADGRRDAGLADASLGEVFSEMNQMMKEADEDDSGGVTFDEFMLLMAQEAKLPGKSACDKRKQRGRDYSLKEFMDEVSEEELDGEEDSEDEV